MPISQEREVPIRKYNKLDFNNLKPLNDAKTYSGMNSLICYRIEDIEPILKELNQMPFTLETRDKSYEIIIHLTIKNRLVIRNLDIPTGFKKSKVK